MEGVAREPGDQAAFGRADGNERCAVGRSLDRRLDIAAGVDDPLGVVKPVFGGPAVKKRLAGSRFARIIDDMQQRHRCPNRRLQRGGDLRTQP